MCGRRVGQRASSGWSQTGTVPVCGFPCRQLISAGVAGLFLLSSSDGAPGLGPGPHVPRARPLSYLSPLPPGRRRLGPRTGPPCLLISAGPRWRGVEQPRGRGALLTAQTLGPLLGVAASLPPALQVGDPGGALRACSHHRSEALSTAQPAPAAVHVVTRSHGQGRWL